jgi:Icc-related predicted phosphoesterase
MQADHHKEVTTKTVRILHLSDTHGLHDSIEQSFPLPAADILIHTGDFTDHGAEAEIQDFNRWLGQIRSRFAHIIVIFGNHEWKLLTKNTSAGEAEQMVEASRDPKAYAQSLVTNAIVLDHEEINVRGIRIYGSSWCPWHPAACQDDAAIDRACSTNVSLNTARDFWYESRRATLENGTRDVPQQRFNEIPEGVDILLTHGAAYGIFDQLERSDWHWGSSQALYEAICRAKPRVHLFGHLHEQRGVWKRHCVSADVPFQGGVEYKCVPGEQWPSKPPPPPAYPCQLISCNAMKNNPRLDGRGALIAGPARLILAERQRIFKYEVICTDSSGKAAIAGSFEYGLWTFT